MAAPDATKQRTVGAYEIGPRLGRGAASEVYAARHPIHGNHLAIKLLHGTLETTSARPVVHPNIVRVVEVGPDFVAMERIDGEDLAARLARGTLSELDARALFAAIADGMAAVHAVGIVHRDLKPANIMLTAGGTQPVIVDFGIAKSLGDAVAAATSRRIGTPAYMAPEQMTGGVITPALDVWAFGVMLFESLTNTLPFAGFAEGRAPQLFEAAPRVGTRVTVSFALDTVIARCLDRDLARRPRSMADIARELRAEPSGDAERITQDAGSLLPAVRALDEPPATTTTPPRARASIMPARRKRAVLIAALAAVSVAVGFVLARGTGHSETTTGAGPTPTTVTTLPTTIPTTGRTPPITVTSAATTAPMAETAPPIPAPKSTRLVVMLTSMPAGAMITIDGNSRGRTPARLELAAPTRIALRRVGYRAQHVMAKRSGDLFVRLVPRSKRPRGETLD